VPIAREEKLQEWEGRVTEVHDDAFVAHLIDLTAGHDHEQERAIVPITEISDSDRKLLRENAVFRWVIGYRHFGATKERFGRIVFRRLPAWSISELEQARRNARKVAGRIVWN
jgi:hypothetical protein